MNRIFPLKKATGGSNHPPGRAARTVWYTRHVASPCARAEENPTPAGHRAGRYAAPGRTGDHRPERRLTKMFMSAVAAASLARCHGR